MSDSQLTKDQQRSRGGYPNWAYPSKRAFQREKRRQLRALKTAIDEARSGCAWAPGYPKQWQKLESAFKALFEAARPENWK